MLAFSSFETGPELRLTAILGDQFVDHPLSEPSTVRRGIFVFISMSSPWIPEVLALATARDCIPTYWCYIGSVES